MERVDPNALQPVEVNRLHHDPYPPITLAEKSGAVLLLTATILIGLKPDLLLDWINPALQSPLFQAVLKGGAS